MVQSRLILCSTINFAQTTRLVPAQYSSIQSAIDASVSNDIILVAPGTYNENIDFGNKTLILKGSSSPDSTFLNGNGVDGIVILNGAGGIIQNFSIYNCPIGIRSESASKIFIVNCKIYDNNIYGIHNFGLGEVKIINSLFHHNGVGFFQNYYGVESYIQNSTFSDNTTDIDFQPGYGTTVGLHIFNSIIRGQVQGTADNKVTLNYCNYDPSKLGTNVDIGEGCQTANPLFKNASSGNYRLSLSSPCIDAGTIDTTGLNIPQTDLDNKIRIWQGIIDIGSYEYGSITPTVVVLQSPLNYSVGLVSPIELKWLPSNFTVSYRLQVSTDKSFTSLIVDSNSMVNTSYTLVEQTYLKTYYWRVRANFVGGLSEWSDVWNFKTLGEPTIVKPLLPLTNSINLPIELDFVWNRAIDKFKATKGNGIQAISNYWFELSSNISDVSYLIDSLLTDTTKHVSGLANLTDYYWRVRAKNQTGWGSYSNWSKFTTIINSPSVVTLVSPTNNSERIIKPVKLSWIKSSFAESFTLQLSIDVNFTTAVLDSSGIIDSNLVFVNLSDLTNYYWRVKASNAGGESDWSEVWRFATLGTPTSPILISPENNIELPDTTTNVKFAWSSVNAADSYSFEASNSQSFDSLLVSTDLSDTSYTYSNGLIAGTFFWRVNAKNQAGIGEYSETFAINIVLTDVDGRGNQIPQEYVLSQNYPNPFNPSTMIKYGLPEQSNVKIEIFNILGQSIGVLVNQDKSSGYYETTWNAENLPSGIYLICIKAIGLSYKKNFTQVRKALLLK